MKFARLLICFVLSLSVTVVPLNSLAEKNSANTSSGIYKWVDEDGKVHFSTKPLGSKAKPANLPEIAKESYQAKINQLKSITPDNCSAHHGVNCEAGPDSDGSVVCNDGYRNAVLQFKSKCLEAKFKVASIEVEKEKVLLTLRNNSPATAQGVKISISNNKFRRDQRLGMYQAEGPSEVEPWSVAEYTMPLPPLPDFGNSISYRIRCKNCNGVTRALGKLR